MTVLGGLVVGACVLAALVAGQTPRGRGFTSRARWRSLVRLVPGALLGAAAALTGSALTELWPARPSPLGWAAPLLVAGALLAAATALPGRDRR